MRAPHKTIAFLKHHGLLAWQIATSFAILAGAAIVGRILVAITHVPIPSSLVGLLVLFALLACGAVKLSWVESGAKMLLGVMALFFVPPAVGLVDHLDVLMREWPVLVVGTSTATMLLLVVVGWATERRA